jgi:hypothetical protein
MPVGICLWEIHLRASIGHGVCMYIASTVLLLLCSLGIGFVGGHCTQGIALLPTCYARQYTEWYTTVYAKYSA